MIRLPQITAWNISTLQQGGRTPLSPAVSLSSGHTDFWGELTGYKVQGRVPDTREMHKEFHRCVERSAKIFRPLTEEWSAQVHRIPLESSRAHVVFRRIYVSISQS